ncbi:MAG: hypothetical protein SGPRY_005746 [Prymnesium sp.]
MGACSILLLHAASGAMRGAALGSAALQTRLAPLPPRLYMLIQPDEIRLTSGDYQVNTGSWPIHAPTSPQLAPKPRNGRKKEVVKPTRKRNRGGKPSGKRGERTSDAASKGERRKANMGSPVLRRVLQRIRKLSDGASFEEVAELLEGKKLSARDYGTVLAELRRLGMWRVVLHLCSWLEAEPGPLPNEMHFLAMISACATCRQPEAALTLLSRFESLSRDLPLDAHAKAIAHVIAAHVGAAKTSEALRLLDRLDELKGADVSLPSLTFGYVSAMRVLDSNGDWEAALKAYFQ